jgi:hypothetical protein
MKNLLGHDDPRAELLRVMSHRIGQMGLSANRVKKLFGRNVTDQDLHAIHEGDPNHQWLLRRLIGFASELGIETVIYPVVGPMPNVPAVAERYRRSA